MKSSTITRGSDRRRVKQNIGQSFPAFSQDMLDQVLPGKASMSTISIIAHSGSTAVVYVVEGEPLVFEVESVLYPTVYLLWKLPNTLPCVTTWSPVINKLQGGADLMLPGVVTEARGGCALHGMTKGQVCAVNAVENRSPVGVVVALMSHEEMLSCGMKGKGFRTVHLYGDHLWEMGSKVHPPVVAMTAVNMDTESSDESCGTQHDPEAGREQKEEIREVTSIVGRSDATVQSEDVSEGGGHDDDGDGHDDDGDGGGSETALAHDQLLRQMQQLSCSDEEEVDNPIKTMDAFLMDCFLQSLKSRMTQSDLPILVSTFYKAHMMELCHTGLHLDIKKTSYKKLSKFLADMQEQGLVEVKANSKGAEIITTIHFSHPLLKTFVPTVLVCQSEGTAQPGGPQTAPPESKALEYKHLYMPTHKMLSIFSSHGYNKSSMLEVGQVREVVTTYIRSNDLVAKDNPRMVVLDPVLTDVMYKKGEELPTAVTWQEVMERVIQGMNLAHSLTTCDGKTIMRKGRLEPIALSVVRRASNKNCTLVDNLELYGIVPDEFARTMQRLAAASTTVTEGKAGVHQVMVQGNAVKAIAKLLQDTYGIPLQCIEGLEKIKKANQR